MKSSLKKPITTLTGLFAIGMIVGIATPAHALTWNGGPGVWNNTNANWSGTSVWAPGGLAQFPNSGAAIVTIGDNLNVGALQFNTVNSGPYTFSNSGGYTVDFTGAGISSATTNLQVINSNGAINFNNGSTAGDSSISIGNTGSVSFLNTSNAGTSNLTNSGSLTFANTSSASNSIIDNTGSLVFDNASTGGTTAISNGGFLDITAHAGPAGIGLGGGIGSLSIGSLNNLSGGQAGAIILGQNQLQIGGNFSLANIPQNSIDFTLNTPGTSGNIKLTGGALTSFTSSGAGKTDLLIEAANGGNGPVAAGTYTLIDWSGTNTVAPTTGDFVLGPLPYGVYSETLVVNGSTLQLIVVPEPSSLVMPFAAVLGMVWLRRRAARMAAV